LEGRLAIAICNRARARLAGAMVYKGGTDQLQGERRMTVFMSVIVIGGIFAIIGICVMSHYRSKGDYKRIFTNGAPFRHRRKAGETHDPSLMMFPMTDTYSAPAHHSQGSTDCGASHGGDAGGSCSDGGGGGGSH
jgi:hypothetical protein